MSNCKCNLCIHDSKNEGTEKTCGKCIVKGGEEDLYIEIDSSKYPDNIMYLLRERFGLDIDDVSRDDEINSMSVNEVFESALEREGLGEHISKIYFLIESIFGIDL